MPIRKNSTPPLGPQTRSSESFGRPKGWVRISPQGEILMMFQRVGVMAHKAFLLDPANQNYLIKVVHCRSFYWHWWDRSIPLRWHSSSDNLDACHDIQSIRFEDKLGRAHSKVYSIGVLSILLHYTGPPSSAFLTCRMSLTLRLLKISEKN